MILAYCPALDFNPKEIYVTFDQILSILQSGKTNYQIAADLHALFETQPSPQTHKAIVKSRKPRGPNKPKPSPLLLTSGNENQDVN